MIALYNQYEFRHPAIEFHKESYEPSATYYIGPFQIEPFSLEHRGWCCGFILTNPHDNNQKKVVVSSDTIPCSSLKTALEDADIAILEGTTVKIQYCLTSNDPGNIFINIMQKTSAPSA